MVYHRGNGWPPSRLAPLALSSSEEALLVSGLMTLGRRERGAER